MKRGKVWLLMLLALTSCSDLNSTSDEAMIKKAKVLYEENEIFRDIVNSQKDNTTSTKILYDKEKYYPLLDFSEACVSYIEQIDETQLYRLVLADEVLSLALNDSNGFTEVLYASQNKPLSAVIAPYRDYFSGSTLYFVDLSSEENQIVSDLQKSLLSESKLEEHESTIKTWSQQKQSVFFYCSLVDSYLGLFFSDSPYGHVAKNLAETISSQRRKALLQKYKDW